MVMFLSQYPRVTLPEQATAQTFHKRLAGFSGNYVWQEMSKLFLKYSINFSQVSRVNGKAHYKSVCALERGRRDERFWDEEAW